MATPAQYQAEIKRLDGLIEAGITQENALRTAASTWKADADGMKIRSGNKGDSDRAERERKYEMYENYIRLAQEKNAEVVEFRQLRASQMILKGEAEATSKQVALTLANQGLTVESSLQKATSEGEALKIKTAGDAQATVTNAEADASNKKKVGLIIAGIGLVIVVAVSVILYKKFKKKA